MKLFSTKEFDQSFGYNGKPDINSSKYDIICSTCGYTTCGQCGTSGFNRELYEQDLQLWRSQFNINPHMNG